MVLAELTARKPKRYKILTQVRRILWILASVFSTKAWAAGWGVWRSSSRRRWVKEGG